MILQREENKGVELAVYLCNDLTYEQGRKAFSGCRESSCRERRSSAAPLQMQEAKARASLPTGAGITLSGARQGWPTSFLSCSSSILRQTHPMWSSPSLWKSLV